MEKNETESLVAEILAALNMEGDFLQDDSASVNIAEYLEMEG